MNRMEITVNMTGLQFERDYGCNRRTGWTALHHGCVVVQFVSLPYAVYRLIGRLVHRRWNPAYYQ